MSAQSIDVPGSPHLPQEPTERLVRDRDILLRYLEGQDATEIAAAKRIPVEWVQRILKSKAVREEITRLQHLANEKWLSERIESLSLEALDKLRETMRGENVSELQFKAAKEILDKNPLLKVKLEPDGAARELAAGLGEAIIQRLTQQEAELKAQRQSIDVTPKGDSADEK